jgi:hypothetical protein
MVRPFYFGKAFHELIERPERPFTTWRGSFSLSKTWRGLF